MPDVTRSDSQRSDASLRPRVSFNRDVHVKRIVPREGARVAGALSADGEGQLIKSPVRKERLTKTKRELKEEAARVINDVDKIDCISSGNGVLPEKFYTLPARRRERSNPDFTENSLDRRRRRRNSEDLLIPPKKPPRTFATNSKEAIFNIFQKEPRKSNLRRSVSDASNLKTSEVPVSSKKKQLSPIIEGGSVGEDYFAIKPSTSFKENDKNVDNGVGERKASVTEQLKEYIDEVDTAILNERRPEVVVIDVDKAEKISHKSRPKLGTAALGKKIKSIANKKIIKAKAKEKPKPNVAPNNKVKDAIENLRNTSEEKTDNTMIHSSQKPVDKLPLTRGRTVNSMVKRLSHESSSPPPKTNVLISPNVSVQHNNNQPFSYTRGLSPERVNASPIIYAQVVCGNNGPKQTVHAAYNNGKKQLQHSDSDEGLGYEENSGFREKSITHFGDEKFFTAEEEYPITPKFKSNGFNGFSSFESKLSNRGVFIDSSSRGRGDGMDAKRRESLTETAENGLTSKFNGSSNNLNSRKDLSARRDLLESRINRRFGDKVLRTSPEYAPKTVYATETTSRYYRSGSTSPIGIREKYVRETRTDSQRNQITTTNLHTKQYLGDERDGYRVQYNYDNEPKSFDSHVSDYRSSPENQRHFETSHRMSSAYHQSKYTTKNEKLTKDRALHKSNPEITHRANYDSLSRGNVGKKERFFDHNECERKDKFGDSGIENDFRHSGERRVKRREFSNESEDEGFASSLLIASERQHTADNLQRNKGREYDSDRGYEPYNKHNNNNGEYKSYKGKVEYVSRERSIDDGSHFDPRIDKNLDKDRGTLKKLDKKPPKPEKKSSLEKMKQLFTGGKKKKDKPELLREDSLRARYTEYKGAEPAAKTHKKGASETNTGYDYNSRRRLSTPSPSPTRELQRTEKNGPTNGSWFKSLDRLSRKKTKKNDKEGNLTSTEDETTTKPTKNLRFFGDTDLESNDSVRHKSALKPRPGLTSRDRARSQSSRDLHNISEESYKTSHKSMLNISAESDRDIKGSRLSLKPPASPSHRSRDAVSRPRRRKNEVSSVESSTEGDSSQQSQRSVVYLHAATVGDIPGPGYLRNGRRAASREELASNSSSRIQPQVKTLSRSFSVLAPWKPRHYRESMDIDYTQYPKPTKNGKYEQNKNGSSRKEASSTLKKRAQESRRSNQSTSTLNRRSRSKENMTTLKRSSEAKGSSSSLYKKKERQPKEYNNRYNKEDKSRMATKSMSVESLGSNRSGRKGDVSRSVSMPRDPEKSAGWFNKKSKKTVSTQRL